MLNNNYYSSNSLDTFGWNLSFIGDINLSADNNGNIYISNLGIENIFPQQATTDETANNSQNLNSRQLLQFYSPSQRVFKQQADGTYQDSSGTLTWNIDHYELDTTNGSKIVFLTNGRLNYVEYSNGYRLNAEYNNGVLTKLSGNNEDSFTVAYNSDQRIETVTDNDRLVDIYNYDATGQYLLSVEDANGITSFSYNNPFDPTLVSSVTYGDGLKVSYDYDHFGRLQQVVYGEGRESISYIFGKRGEVTSITDANGVQVLYEYDSNGRLVDQRIAGSDQGVNYSYGDAGELTVTDSDGATVDLSLNEQGLFVSQLDILNRLTELQYDSQGNLTGINAPQNFKVAYSYDEQGNLTSLIDPLNNEIKFNYKLNNQRLETVIDGRKNELNYSYDEQGNLTVITYEDGSSENFKMCICIF